MKISGLIASFNEEKRIAGALASLQWCDEVVLVDKESVDRTVEIAKTFKNVKVISMPNKPFSTEEIDLGLSNSSGEWLVSFTCSDLLHPACAEEIRRLVSQNDFPYDIIHVPFRRFVLGLESRRSPWYSSHSPKIYRRSIIKINRSSVHDAVLFDSDRHYKMKYSDTHCMFHLTHVTVDSMMDRHLRYLRAEGVTGKNESHGKSFKAVLKSFYIVLIARRSFLAGWKGVMLAMAYISYFMMAFVYKWESKHSEAPVIYQGIREKLLKDWETSRPGKQDNQRH